MVSWQTVGPSSAPCRGRPAIRWGGPPGPRPRGRRPAGLQPVGDVRAQALVGRELPTPLSASARQVLGVQGEVAAEAPVAVAEAVTAQLTVDRGRVAAEPGGDLADRGARLHEAEEGASCVEVELAVGPGQGRLRRANPCKG